MNSYQKTYSNLNPKFEFSRNIKEGIHQPPNNSISILSRFGNTKLLTDTSLNKYYKKYIQKQVHIQHQQKIYDLIEKMDDTKVFNSLKAEYLREKALLQNIHNNKKKENKRVIYASNYINLNNCKEKLNAIYKLSTQDLNFMASLMHYLGNRPKKIYKAKINKKLEALSQGKLALFLKRKELSKQESNTNTLYNYNPCNSDNLIARNPYLKYFLKDSKDSNNNTINNFMLKKEKIINSNNNYSFNNFNNNILSKTNQSFFKRNSLKNNIKINLRRGSIGIDVQNRGLTQRFLGKTKSTNFGMTNYNNFISNVKTKERKFSVYNNIRTENLITNSESQNNSSNLEEKNLKNNNLYNNYNLPYSRTKSKFNSQSSLFSLNNNKSRSRSKNSTSKKIKTETKNNFNNRQNQNQIENQIISAKINTEVDINKNINKDSDDNYYDDLSILSNLKNHDKTTIKNKLIKKYKSTMNEFLQKIKDEEKDLYNNSNKLSKLLNQFKKYGSFDYIKKSKNKKNKNILGQKNTLQQQISTNTINLTDKKQFESLKTENENHLMTKTFYPNFGKSKFSFPYINKIVYGEENSLDPFEQLQKDLFFEVKNEIRKNNISNRKKGKKIISINGKLILKKFKNSNFEMEESETNT